jgi:hypothetical protein
VHAEPVSHSQARAILRGRLRSPSAAPRHPRRTYFRRERAEGKKSLEALRCLKRRISDVIYRNLVADEERAAGTDLEVAPRRALRAVSRIQRDRRLPYIDTSDQPPRTRTSNATPDITTRAGPTRQRPCTDRLLNRREAKGSTLSGALSSGAFRTRNAQRRARPESGPPHNGTASRRKRIVTRSVTSAGWSRAACRWDRHRNRTTEEQRTVCTPRYGACPTRRSRRGWSMGSTTDTQWLAASTRERVQPSSCEKCPSSAGVQNRRRCAPSGFQRDGMR